jgi:hypothetical protein
VVKVVTINIVGEMEKKKRLQAKGAIKADLVLVIKLSWLAKK